jgi:hypothetical protein
MELELEMGSSDLWRRNEYGPYSLDHLASPPSPDEDPYSPANSSSLLMNVGSSSYPGSAGQNEQAGGPFFPSDPQIEDTSESLSTSSTSAMTPPEPFPELDLFELGGGAMADNYPVNDRMMGQGWSLRGFPFELLLTVARSLERR